MKRVIIALLLLFSVPALAQYDKKPRIISRSGQIFNNINCADTNTCDLIQIKYLAEDYEIWIDTGMHYGTRLFAHYTTNSINALENYAFVQFIKGCQYHSYNNGKVSLSVSTENFLKQRVFNYKDWTIESSDADPIYFSTPASRHFNYKWNINKDSVDRTTEKYFGLEKPIYPELYISDIPYQAFYMNGTAKNISLAFKTCLYRTLDIPLKINPEDVNFAEPINCFYWYSSWVYNHDPGKFENPYEIAPACNK